MSRQREQKAARELSLIQKRAARRIGNQELNLEAQEVLGGLSADGMKTSTPSLNDGGSSSPEVKSFGEVPPNNPFKILFG